jgi:hypothetical protein
MNDKKRKVKSDRIYWIGFLSGPIILVILYSSQSFELLRDALGNTLPLFFTPGILEISLFFIGFSIVIIVNYLLRREQDDEWVMIEVSESDSVEKKKDSP